MLSSFNIATSSSSHQDQDKPPPPPSDGYLHHHRHRSLAPPPIHMRQLLLTCVDLISCSDLSAANRIITILSTNSSPYGDSTERLVHQFTKALALHLKHGSGMAATSSSNDDALIQSSYLSLNKITPFIRFSHLTANQAILEAISGQQAIHILDLDIMHGLQWPPLMQAVAERFPLPTLRITATGTDFEILRRTGDRLTKFAHSLGLRFQFHPIVYEDPISIISSVLFLPDETLVVNSVHYLHRLLHEPHRFHHLLHRIKAMSPRVFTVAEREANHNHPTFQRRFAEALEHYAAVFDSLEATLPPNSDERMAVEQIWFGREITNIVAADEEHRMERHEKFRSWEMMLKNTGFTNITLSPFALSQAKLLLRLHYPSEGYRLQLFDGSFFLGWQNQPLFSISSWH